MADRYQDRPFPADDDQGESDPLAELARLIGQTDPFGSVGRANPKVQPRSAPVPDPYRHQPPPAVEDDPPAGPPPWMQRANRQEIRKPAYDEPEPEPYQDGYEDGGDDQRERRRGGLVTVIAVLALAVVGTGAAFAYRSYVGTPRSGDPPVIRADNSPTKIVPSPGDTTSKTPDRMPAGDGAEKIVPREEAPVDVNARTGGGPRVVFPPLNPNGNPPSVASVAPSNVPVASAGPVPSNGSLPN